MKFFLSILIFLSFAVQSHADTYETVKLAKAYYYGTKDVRKDYTQAKRYFLEAAQDQSLDAYRYLGVIYLFGHGADVDYDRAKMWLNKAIARGDQRSQEIYDTYLGPKEFKSYSDDTLADNDENVIIKKEYHANGRPACITPYVNGKKEGIQKCYFEDGTLMSKTSYQNGKEDGKKMFYKNNMIIAELSYVNGKEGIGKLYSYHENGNLFSETTVNGEKKVTKQYHQNGKLDTETFIINGEIKVMKTYRENGTLDKEAHYTDVRGAKEGIIKGYDDGGRLIYKAHTKNGKLVGSPTFY